MKPFPAGPARHALERRARCADMSVRELAETLPVNRSTLLRLYDREWLRYDAADLIATALGHHPSELWADWFDPSDVPRSADCPATDDLIERTAS